MGPKVLKPRLKAVDTRTARAEPKAYQKGAQHMRHSGQVDGVNPPAGVRILTRVGLSLANVRVGRGHIEAVPTL
jgi:hypothetical protein